MKHHVHHVKSAFSSIHEHLVAFAVAGLLVAWIAWVVVYRDSLFADITAWWQVQQEYGSPLVYAVQDWKLLIRSTKKFTEADSLSFYIFFDPTSVLVWLDKASSQFEYTYAPWEASMTQVTLFITWEIPENTVLYEVPVDGSVDNITVTNASIMWGDVLEQIAIQKN